MITKKSENDMSLFVVVADFVLLRKWYVHTYTHAASKISSLTCHRSCATNWDTTRARIDGTRNRVAWVSAYRIRCVCWGAWSAPFWRHIERLKTKKFRSWEAKVSCVRLKISRLWNSFKRTLPFQHQKNFFFRFFEFFFCRYIQVCSIRAIKFGTIPSR